MTSVINNGKNDLEKKAKKRKEDKEDYEFFKSLNICVNCRSDDAMIGAARCPECAGRLAEKAKKRWVEIKKCPEKHKAYKERYNVWANKTRAKRREKNICHRCGKKPAEKGFALCHECLIARRRKRRLPLERSSRADCGLCYICGKPVVEGKRSCLEHYTLCIKNFWGGRMEVASDEDSD